MASYRIEWKQSARKELRNLHKQDIARVLAMIEKPAHEPRPAGYRKLSGSDNHYPVCIGDIRVIDRSRMAGWSSRLSALDTAAASTRGDQAQHAAHSGPRLVQKVSKQRPIVHALVPMGEP